MIAKRAGNEKKIERAPPRTTEGWMDGSMDQWINGLMGQWIKGPMDARIGGCLVGVLEIDRPAL